MTWILETGLEKVMESVIDDKAKKSELREEFFFLKLYGEKLVASLLEHVPP